MVKVWPLVDNRDATLRIVIINKLPADGANVTLAPNRWGAYGAGALTRLISKNGMTEKLQIYLGGQTYAGTGDVLAGARMTEVVPRRPAVNPGRPGTWVVYMPPGSAALLTVPARK